MTYKIFLWSLVTGGSVLYHKIIYNDTSNWYAFVTRPSGTYTQNYFEILSNTDPKCAAS